MLSRPTSPLTMPLSGPASTEPPPTGAEPVRGPLAVDRRHFVPGLVAGLFTTSTQAMSEPHSFEAALARHLQAIERRDFAAFESTLTTGQTLSFVSLGGKVTRTRHEFAGAMRQWLADPDWRWQLERISVSVAAETGVAVLGVRYHDRDAAGRPYELNYVLSLVFAREGGDWRLVHDQNTPVRA